MSHTARIVSLFAITTLAACAPQKMPGMKIGNPYVVEGKSYYPSYDANYDKTGEASWYGPGFHGKYTASGEVYDQHDYTAAHPTLPMPSLVRVTNLATGKSLIVRINDRGPFAANRIIDLSKDSARALGIRGVARVRVQFLEKETQEYVAMVKQNDNRIISMADYNERADLIKKSAPLMAADISPQIAIPSAGVTEKNVSPPPQPKAGIIREAMANDTVEGDNDDNTVSPLTPIEVNANDGEVTSAKPSQPISMSTPVEEPAREAEPAAEIEPAPVAAMGAYAIQLGSFASEANAHKLAAKLAGIAQASIREVEVHGRLWWQVRINGFNDRAEAAETLRQVHGAGVPDARIIRP